MPKNPLGKIYFHLTNNTNDQTLGIGYVEFGTVESLEAEWDRIDDFPGESSLIAEKLDLNGQRINLKKVHASVIELHLNDSIENLLQKARTRIIE